MVKMYELSPDLHNFAEPVTYEKNHINTFEFVNHFDSYGAPVGMRIAYGTPSASLPSSRRTATTIKKVWARNGKPERLNKRGI